MEGGLGVDRVGAAAVAGAGDQFFCYIEADLAFCEVGGPDQVVEVVVCCGHLEGLSGSCTCWIYVNNTVNSERCQYKVVWLWVCQMNLTARPPI